MAIGRQCKIVYRNNRFTVVQHLETPISNISPQLRIARQRPKRKRIMRKKQLADFMPRGHDRRRLNFRLPLLLFQRISYRVNVMAPVTDTKCFDRFLF